MRLKLLEPFVPLESSVSFEPFRSFEAFVSFEPLNHVSRLNHFNHSSHSSRLNHYNLAFFGVASVYSALNRPFCHMRKLHPASGFSLQSDQVIYFHDIQDPTSDGMDNPAYGGISPDHSPQIHPHNAEKSKILRNNQTTQASSRRPEDIKVGRVTVFFI